MAQTALDLSPEQWRSYRPGHLIGAGNAGQTKRLQRRRRQAWRVARQAAELLRNQYDADKVVVFGSLVRDDWFTPWSDIDLAAWGIPPDRFYGAVAAVTGLSAVFKVDLIDLETCRPAVREAVARDGVEL